MRRLLVLVATALAGFLGWVALTTLATGSSIATWAPCPRNWAWLPTYLPRESPLEALSFKLGKVHVKVCYGSPALRGRTMLGGDSVPFGKLWRTSPFARRFNPNRVFVIVDQRADDLSSLLISAFLPSRSEQLFVSQNCIDGHSLQLLSAACFQIEAVPFQKAEAFA